MSTMTGFVFLFFLGACVHQSSLSQLDEYTRCSHNHHCPESQCCQINDEFRVHDLDDTRHIGYCYDYIPEGKLCAIYDICGCFPGLECLPWDDGSPETTCSLELPKVCTNTALPYVRPPSRALCLADSDCPTSGECCSHIDGSSYNREWHPRFDGHCIRCEDRVHIE